MLKRILQRFGSVMTKIESEAKAVLPSLHSVKSGKIEKSVGHGSSTARAVNDGEKKKRIKMSKYAMLLAYQGKEYFGMQIQKGHPHPTIESHLLDAMHKLGWITEEMRTQPNLFYFQRAARTDKAVSAVRQMCGMQLPLSEEYSITGPAQLNDILPKDIRVVGMRRATNWFHPQKLCDARTYSYTLPTFAFAKPTELTTASFRIKQETIDEINSLLEIYLGTHNFFNYTSKREYNDRSCCRYIMEFSCGKPFLFKDVLRNEDVEFIQITVKGQSFILHQIRKMIGMIITIIRELQLKSYIQKSFENMRIDVPKAPGLGLVLERVHYENYDRRHEKTHQPLSFWGDEVEEKIQEVKFDLITKEILESEIRQQSMMQWLADLVHHDFATDPESEEPPHKSFVTMAAAQANLAINETDECDKSLQHETTQVSVEVGSTTELQENKCSEASLSRS